MSDKIDNDCCETSEHTNVEFFDHGSVLEEVYRHSYDSTRDAGKIDETMCLMDFLKRPVQIGVYTWTNTSTVESFYPYAEMFNHAAIINKVTNYHLFRSDMKIRIVINGSPFNYGRIMVVYMPYSNQNAPFQGVAALAGSDINGPLIAYCSSLPHVWLNPSSNNTVELDVPMMYPSNWIAMGIDSDDVSASEGFTALGQILMIPTNTLRQSNGGTDPSVNYTVYGIFTNPEVAGPVNQYYSSLFESDFVYEMDAAAAGDTVSNGKKVSSEGVNVPTKIKGSKGPSEDKEGSENGGKFSRTTFSVSNWLGHLSDVPIIGPYAKASAMALSGVGTLAKLFGFSRPYDLSPERVMLKRNIPDMATTTGVFPGYKLAVDPNNAVTVDPRVGGFSIEDEMSIPYLASKEFYLQTWEINSTTAAGDAIGSGLLTDCQAHNTSYNSGDAEVWVPSPIRFVTANFQYWKGTLKYRFQVVASQYHRARVLIYYNPNSELYSATAPTEIPMTTNVVKVLDLQELDGFVMEFPWSNARTMCRTGLDVWSSLTPTNTYVNQEEYQYNNGFFQMVLVNELTSPLDTVSPVDINVWVSCPDLQVAKPKYRSSLFIDPVAPASLFEEEFLYEGNDSDFAAFDSLEGYSSFAVRPFDTGRLMSVINGEDCRSLRLLLKRFHACDILSQEGTRPATRYVAVNYPLYPRTTYFSTTYSSGSSLTNTWVSTKPGQISPFETMRFAYLACRGGGRFIFTATNGYLSNITATTANQGAITYASSNSIGTGDLFSNAIIDGSGVTWAQEQSTIPVEVPYYTVDRFKLCIHPEFSTGVTDTSVENGVRKVQVTQYVNTAGSTATRETATVAWAAADDFQFHYFICAPPIYEDNS